MNPQGSSLINVAAFDAIISRIETAPTCADLEALAADALGSVGGVQDAINDQIAALAPVLALLSIPSDPLAVVTWVADFITLQLTPQLKPYTDLAAQLAAMAAQVTRLEDAISAAAERFPDCSISL